MQNPVRKKGGHVQFFSTSFINNHQNNAADYFQLFATTDKNKFNKLYNLWNRRLTSSRCICLQNSLIKLKIEMQNAFSKPFVHAEEILTKDKF